MTAHAESMLPLILRLNALEAKVDGANIYPETDYRKDGPTKNGESSKTALRRVQGIQETLERIGGNNEAIRRFIDNCKSGMDLTLLFYLELTGSDDTYLPLLSMPDPSSSSTTDGDILDPAKDTAGGVSDYDLIPDKVKVTMLLEAAADIKGLERDLREVEVLKGRGVEGAGQLEGKCWLGLELWYESSAR